MDPPRDRSQPQGVTKIRVVSYEGYRANERPLSFEVEGQRRAVTDILDRWYGVEHDYWKVLADDGRVYLLKWHRSLDVWLLVKIFERAGTH